MLFILPVRENHRTKDLDKQSRKETRSSTFHKIATECQRKVWFTSVIWIYDVPLEGLILYFCGPKSSFTHVAWELGVTREAGSGQSMGILLAGCFCRSVLCPCASQSNLSQENSIQAFKLSHTVQLQSPVQDVSGTCKNDESRNQKRKKCQNSEKGKRTFISWLR